MSQRPRAGGGATRSFRFGATSAADQLRTWNLGASGARWSLEGDSQGWVGVDRSGRLPLVEELGQGSIIAESCAGGHHLRETRARRLGALAPAETGATHGLQAAAPTPAQPSLGAPSSAHVRAWPYPRGLRLQEVTSPK